MRATSVFAVTAVLILAGCQESKTTSETSSSTSGTSSTVTTTGETAATTPAPTAGATTPGGAMSTADLTKADKSMEVAIPGGGSARLQYTDLKVGDGSIAEAGKVAMVHYTGWLTDGTKFDSSLDRGQPFQFKIGEGGVIQGWDKGVLGMRVGGKRKLVIPSELGYGARGAGGVIPPNATLVFEVELLGLQ